jgi:hypothetical protein
MSKKSKRHLRSVGSMSMRSEAKTSSRSGVSEFGTTCTDLSCPVSDTAGILRRVKALEDALQGEKTLREKMETMLNKIGDGRLPGVTLPHLPIRS